jgi:heavy metal sensor kinase
MRSIRLSLMLYFSGLLAVALTAASLLVYHNAELTLQAKQQAMAQLIDKQYSERCEKEKAHLDADLLAEAQLLARLVQVQLEWYRADLIQPLFLFGLVSSNFSPNAYVLAPLWLAEGVREPRFAPPNPSSVSQFVHRAIRPHLLKVKLDEMLLPGDSQVGEYYQIDCPPGDSHYSPSMGGRKFLLDTSAFPPNQVVYWVFDDTKLGPTTPVHRVVFQVSRVGTVFPRVAPGSGPGSRERRANQPTSPRAGSDPSGTPPIRRGPTVYVHCAASTDKLEAALAGFRQQRDDDLVKVANETRDSLHSLRHWLWGISLAVFAATAAGTFALVRLGLSPLRRLSHAVSQVSAKDFRLPLDERPLPSELRPIVERLRSTLDLLKRAFAREKQAAADISHELRTPLAALLTTTEFALRKPRSPEQYRELLSDCHTSAQQMHQIIDRLLTLARLDAGVDRLRVQAVDVAALAQQCAAVVRPLAEARGLKLTFKSSPSVLAANGRGGDGASLVQVDPDKLREIVTNLLHNAIEYNRPGGSIDLRVARENGTLEVEVQDTGIGIAPESRALIFERFYRADPSRGGDDLHAGLGLAIVKEYIDLMGGSIGVESIEGQGSTFRVLLPMR